MAESGPVKGAIMAYLDEITRHWQHSIQLARLRNANDMQLRCMRDLSTSEFGYASNMRLRLDCKWSTSVDKDGDVVLFFCEPVQDGQYGARVTVCIDHLGLVTTKDLNTGEVVVYDPHAELTGWSGTDTMIWVLDNKVLRQFTEPSLRIEPDLQSCEITERRQMLTPFFYTERYGPNPDVTQITIRDAEQYARLHGELHWFEVLYTDDVSRERVLVLCELTTKQKLKAHANRLMGWLESFARRKRKGSASATIRLPRFSTEGFGAKQTSYCAL